MHGGCTGLTGRLVWALLILRRVVLLCMTPFLARLMRSLVSKLSFLPLFQGTEPCQSQMRLVSRQQMRHALSGQECCKGHAIAKINPGLGVSFKRHTAPALHSGVIREAQQDLCRCRDHNEA